MIINKRYLVLRDCNIENTTYELLKLTTVGTNDINEEIEKVQNRIYELKDKIGEEYTVEEVLNILLDEFANCAEAVAVASPMKANTNKDLNAFITK